MGNETFMAKGRFVVEARLTKGAREEMNARLAEQGTPAEKGKTTTMRQISAAARKAGERFWREAEVRHRRGEGMVLNTRAEAMLLAIAEEFMREENVDREIATDWAKANHPDLVEEQIREEMKRPDSLVNRAEIKKKAEDAIAAAAQRLAQKKGDTVKTELEERVEEIWQLSEDAIATGRGHDTQEAASPKLVTCREEAQLIALCEQRMERRGIPYIEAWKQITQEHPRLVKKWKHALWD